MTIKELKEKIKDAPDDALVYAEADHGQMAEPAGYVGFNIEPVEEDEYYAEDREWEDECTSKVTRVLISAY